MPRSARRYGSSARNGEASPDLSARASSSGVGVTRRIEIGSSRASALMRCRWWVNEVSDWLATAARNTSAVTFGLPSRSPPIHEPMRTALDASTSIPQQVATSCSIVASSSGTTSNRLEW